MKLKTALQSFLVLTLVLIGSSQIQASEVTGTLGGGQMSGQTTEGSISGSVGGGSASGSITGGVIGGTNSGNNSGGGGGSLTGTVFGGNGSSGGGSAGSSNANSSSNAGSNGQQVALLPNAGNAPQTKTSASPSGNALSNGDGSQDAVAFGASPSSANQNAAQAGAITDTTSAGSSAFMWIVPLLLLMIILGAYGYDAYEKNRKKRKF